jgi:hypothetical protein
VLSLLAYHPAEGVFAWRTFGEEEGPQHIYSSILLTFNSSLAALRQETEE